MLTDIEIKDIVYDYISESNLAKSVSGKITKRKRTEAGKEDVAISILSNNNEQLQKALVNVNIYVQDIKEGSSMTENTPRLRELSRIASEVLNRHNGGEWRWELEQQREIASESTNEHVINNRLKFQYANI